jgi:uncharacterized protein YggE
LAAAKAALFLPFCFSTIARILGSFGTMKTGFFAALALAACLTPAWGQATPRTLTMTGQGEVRAAPDLVTLSAGVSSQASTAEAALSANTTHMQSVFAALKKLGIADRDIQTLNFSVSPQMTGGINNQPARVTGYQVNNEVRVQLNDVAKLGAALDALVTAGANQMNGIQFSIKNSAPLLAQARSDAVADARTKAEAYAKAAGVSLGPILSIGENDAEVPRPLYRAVPMALAARPVPVSAGEESISANVSIVWEIH